MVDLFDENVHDPRKKVLIENKHYCVDLFKPFACMNQYVDVNEKIVHKFYQAHKNQQYVFWCLLNQTNLLTL